MGKQTMLMDWYMRVSALLDKIHLDCVRGSRVPDNESAPARIAAGLDAYKTGKLFDELIEVWEEGARRPPLSRETRQRSLFNKQRDYFEFLSVDLPKLREAARRVLQESVSARTNFLGFVEMLHPGIVEHALPLYSAGHLREAVNNGITFVFDMIRQRTQLDLDGKQLVGQVFGMERPRLIFSTLDTDSGRNDQKGFMQIFEGAYMGIRNPKAHSLAHDLDKRKAAEYLVFASLLARRVEEAKEAHSDDGE